jgi:hypothetical protein
MNQCNICGKWTEALMPVVMENEDPEENELINICSDCYETQVEYNIPMHFASDAEVDDG